MLDLLDIILVMTVNPGFGGQAFLHSQLAKIAAVRRMIDDRAARSRSRWTAASRPDTSGLVTGAGADTLIAGTAVFGASDYAAAPSGASGRVARPHDRPHPRWLRDARRAISKLPALRPGRVPDAPALPVRDPWPGDPNRGARLLQGRAGDRRHRRCI